MRRRSRQRSPSAGFKSMYLIRIFCEKRSLPSIRTASPVQSLVRPPDSSKSSAQPILGLVICEIKGSDWQCRKCLSCYICTVHINVQHIYNMHHIRYITYGTSPRFLVFRFSNSPYPLCPMWCVKILLITIHSAASTKYINDQRSRYYVLRTTAIQAQAHPMTLSII